MARSCWAWCGPPKHRTGPDHIPSVFLHLSDCLSLFLTSLKKRNLTNQLRQSIPIISRVWGGRSPVTGKMDAGGGGVLGAVLCMLLVFAIFPLLLWRRRSDAAASASADNHRLPPQPLQEDQVLHGRAAPRRMRRRPGAASSSAASASRDGTRTTKALFFCHLLRAS